MLYRPWPSVTTERTFSMSTGLAASTVTPGKSAPDVSRPSPAIPLACCALTAVCSSKIPVSTMMHIPHTVRACLTISSSRLGLTGSSGRVIDLFVGSFDQRAASPLALKAESAIEGRSGLVRTEQLRMGSIYPGFPFLTTRMGSVIHPTAAEGDVPVTVEN